MAPRAWHPAVWLTACFVLSGFVGGLVSRRYAPDAGVGQMVFWVVAWGALGVAGGLAVRASRRP
ncbi:MAG: hypothetical protein ABWX84_05845 [Nocardioides sp.]